MLRNCQQSGLLLLALAALSSNCFAENPAGIGPQAAAQSVNRFKVALDLQVSPFASEPLVRNPTDMDIDERGRVWVAEGVNYRSSFQKWGVLQPAGDRILTLEYALDGTVKETVFYQDPSVNTALGICVLGNKVIVSDSPNVFVLTDTDGDGKADKRELLFTGIEGKDHDHGVHTFVFGPDGKLYFNMGNEGKQLYYPLTKEVALHGPIDHVAMRPVVDLDGNEVNNDGKPYRMGMVFRCNLDGGEVETLAWNFRNNYEVAVDSFGTLWQSDNDDDGNRGVRINYVMQYGNYGYVDEMTGEGWPTAWAKAKAKGAQEDSKVFYEWHQYDPGVVPNLLHTGAGSPTGMLLYEGQLLPEVFRNCMIHCDALARVVRAYPTQPDGAGYRAEIKNLLTTDDDWFRPVDVCAAPDGSLFVADWNDAGVGGHYMADQKLETMTGRIYRLAPPGNQPSVPPLNLSTATGCVEALKSPNLSTRYLAWTKLHNMQGDAERSLRNLWDKANAPCLRARALQLLARIHGKESHYVQAAIQDANPDLRITGLRIARLLKLNLIPIVCSLARDSSPAVRRECAIALRHLNSPEAPKLWAELALQHDKHDRWYLEALGIGADKQWDSYLHAWLTAVGKHWDTSAGRDIVWRSRSKKTPGLLVKIITDKDLSATQREHYFRSLDFINGPEKEVALLELLTAQNAAPRDTALEALSRLKGTDLEANPAVKSAVLKALDQLRGTAEFVEIVRDFNLKGQTQPLLELAAKDPSGPTGVDAMRLVVSTESATALKPFLDGTNAASFAEALGNTGEKQLVPLLIPLVSEISRPFDVRKQAVQALAKTRDGAATLLDLARANKLPDDLRSIASSELNAVRWDSIKAQAAELLPLTPNENAHVLPPIAELVKLSGDPQKGAGVFRRETVACFKCHQINGEGTDFGPNLSEIGTKLAKPAIYESILDPSAGISFGYEAWQIDLKNGDDALGLLVSETADELALKTVGGIVTRYNRADIARRNKQKISIMPAGLEQAMSSDDLVNLVEYLSSLKKAAK